MEAALLCSALRHAPPVEVRLSTPLVEAVLRGGGAASASLRSRAWLGLGLGLGVRVGLGVGLGLGLARSHACAAPVSDLPSPRAGGQCGGRSSKPAGSSHTSWRYRGDIGEI